MIGLSSIFSSKRSNNLDFQSNEVYAWTIAYITMPSFSILLNERRESFLFLKTYYNNEIYISIFAYFILLMFIWYSLFVYIFENMVLKSLILKRLILKKKKLYFPQRLEFLVNTKQKSSKISHTFSHKYSTHFTQPHHVRYSFFFFKCPDTLLGAQSDSHFVDFYNPPPVVENLLTFDKINIFCNRLVNSQFNNIS